MVINFFLCIIDKVTELQKDLREANRRSKDNETEKENLEMKYNDALESLEMMTLDKEVAEERAENLQQEVSLLKEKLEEVSVDLDILRKDAGNFYFILLFFKKETREKKT